MVYQFWPSCEGDISYTAGLYLTHSIQGFRWSVEELACIYSAGATGVAGAGADAAGAGAGAGPAGGKSGN